MRHPENRRMAFLVVVAFVCVTLASIAATALYAAKTSRELHATDRRIEAVQDQACRDLARIVRRYNRQYDLAIVGALGRVLAQDPTNIVALDVLGAFQRPDFPKVTPPPCD